MENEQQVASSSRARLGERWEWRRRDRKKWRQQMHNMQKGKATGADEVQLEMLEMDGEVGY